ncbi:dihydrodipicolinate synthetase family protein [Colletotrichum kahawae]|uniref:Dihydrodipicolinate synthetase family protein n=1 Tax=Colletotrichum kahawae TaxID=34407 RepID=A0AAD9YSW5_COLKA|nr:dihydrodipicolinate synthetase family protein [Colletotrichum kahawae]
MEAFPAETIVAIMRQSDGTSDLLALASTCRRFYSIFDKFSISILQDVEAPDIPDFKDALAVVRATAIVKESYARGVLPPKPFPFDQLAHGKSPTTLIDYQKVGNAIEFLKLIEAEFAHVWRKYLPYIKENLYDLRRSWEDTFNDSMLKALLMNAVLAGEMAEPYWRAGQKLSDPSSTGTKILQSIEDPRSRHLGGNWQRDESGMTWVIRDHYTAIKDWLNDKDIEYLETYTAYKYNEKNYDATKDISKDLINTTFGKLAEYFGLPNNYTDSLLPRAFQATLRDLQDCAFF